MRYLTILLFLVAVMLIDGHSVRVGEEDRRIWAPVVLAVLTLVLLLRVPLLLRLPRAVLRSPPLVLFLVYLAWLGITQFWSVAPAEGRNHILVLWVALLAALSLSDEKPYATATAYLGCLAIVLVVSWLGVAAGQSWTQGTESTWRLKGHQQVLALVTIAGMILALVWHLNRKRAEAAGRKWLYAAFMALALISLLATKGRSFSVFFVITVFAIYFFHMRGAAKTWVLIAGLVIGGSLYVLVDILLPLISRGNEETLSGRLIVWELTWREIVDRPWGGFGFASYQDYFYSRWNNWAPGHAHNLWLQVTFESGVIGAVLYTLFLLAVARQGHRYQRATGALSYSLALVVFCILAGWTSVFLGEKISTLYGLLLVLTFQEEALRARAVAGAATVPSPDPEASIEGWRGHAPRPA